MRLARRVSYRFDRACTSLWHWTRRRFTAAGLSLLGGAAVAALMSADPEHTLGYQIFPLICCLLAVSVAWGRGFRARFILQRQLPRLATAGIPVFYRVTVGNPGAKAQNGLVLLEDLEDTRPSFEEFVAHWQAERRNLTSFSLKWFSARRPASMARVRSAALPDLPAGGETEALVELLPRRRGVLRFTGATLARPDPLGLFRAFSSMAAPQSLLVLPRRYPLPPIALPGTARHQQGGVALASSVGQSEEFVSLRDYRRGDPIRHIHWRSWAHANKPIVKEFQDEFFVRHALVLDTCGARRGGRAFEEAVSVAASFACSIQTQESLLDLLFVGPQAYCFTAGRGLAHTDQMLEILAAVEPCGLPGLEDLQRLVLGHSAGLSGCVCILLDWDEPRQTLVSRLRVLGIPLLVLVVAEPGAAVPADPGPMRDEPARFHILRAGRIEQGLARL